MDNSFCSPIKKSALAFDESFSSVLVLYCSPKMCTLGLHRYKFLLILKIRINEISMKYMHIFIYVTQVTNFLLKSDISLICITCEWTFVCFEQRSKHFTKVCSIMHFHFKTINTVVEVYFFQFFNHRDHLKHTRGHHHHTIVK